MAPGSRFACPGRPPRGRKGPCVLSARCSARAMPRCSAKAAVANAEGLATLSEVTPDAGEAGDPGPIRSQSVRDGAASPPA